MLIRLTMQISDLTKYNSAIPFACGGPAVEFIKMMILQGLHVIHLHAETVTDNIQFLIKSRAKNLAVILN